MGKSTQMAIFNSYVLPEGTKKEWTHTSNMIGYLVDMIRKWLSGPASEFHQAKTRVITTWDLRYNMEKWIGFVGKIWEPETHGFLPWNWSGFTVNFPIIQFYETWKFRKWAGLFQQGTDQQTCT